MSVVQGAMIDINERGKMYPSMLLHWISRVNTRLGDQALVYHSHLARASIFDNVRTASLMERKNDFGT